MVSPPLLFCRVQGQYKRFPRKSKALFSRRAGESVCAAGFQILGPEIRWDACGVRHAVKRFQKRCAAESSTAHRNQLTYRLSASVSTLTNWEFVELARKRHGFPRGEAVERSETDEERRNEPILHAVRKEGTI